MVKTRSGKDNGEGDSVNIGIPVGQKDGPKEQKDQLLKKTESTKEMDENKDSVETYSFLRSFAYFDDKGTTDISDDAYGQLAHDANVARKSGSFCDITLSVDPEKLQIKGHRLVLASAFDYFRAMLNSNLKEGSQSEVELPKTDAKTMESLIDFAYTGKMKLTNGNIERIATAANFFGMSRLLEKCVNYIIEKINKSNCIEILEFSDQISNATLKDFTMIYITKHIEMIAAKNLDTIKMSTSLLIEIIGNDATSIHADPVENEERLFLIGWNNLHSKSDEEWATSLSKFLKAVHLPLVSESFLCDVASKIENSQEGSALIEEAKLRKQAIESYKATPMQPKVSDDIKWGMERFQTSGKVFVTCHGLKEESSVSWYGIPVFIAGKVFCLHATNKTCTDDGPPVKFLSVYIYCLSDLSSMIVELKDNFETVDPQGKKSHFIGNGTSKFGEKNVSWGYGKYMKLQDVFKDYHDQENDTCTIIAHISDVQVKHTDRKE